MKADAKPYEILNEAAARLSTVDPAVFETVDQELAYITNLIALANAQMLGRSRA